MLSVENEGANEHEKKSHLIRIVVATFALLLTFGCVTQTDMDTLQIERQQDRGRIKQLEAELEESKQLLKEEIEKSQTPVRQRTADMWAEIQSLRADFAKLRGELETMEIRMDRQVGATNSTMTISSLGDQLDEIEFILENQLQVDLPKVREERAAALAASSAAAVMATPSGDANATIAATAAPLKQPEPKTQPAASDPAKALYDKAYALYKDGKI